MIKKIAHISDIHLMKIPTRNHEYESVFNNLYDSLTNNKPDIICITGDFVNDYIDLQGEQIVLASNLLNNLTNIAPVRIVRGNHDYQKSRPKRTDSIEAIVSAMGSKNIVYFNSTRAFEEDNVVWVVWKHGDKENPWKFIEKDESKIYIDLYHDTVRGSVNAHGFEFKGDGYIDQKSFNGDFLFAGHIHKQQFFNKEKTKGYAGSLIAQTFAEGDDSFHGYLLWDIINKRVDLVPIQNEYSFNNVMISQFTDFDDLDVDIANPTKYNRVRFIWATLPEVKNKENIKKLETYIKNKYNVIQIKHKEQFIENKKIVDDIDTTELQNINDSVVQEDIFRSYLTNRGVEFGVIDDVIKLDKYIEKNIKDVTNNDGEWDLVKLSAENFMSYESINIDFRNLDGIIQIAGQNRMGKTTIYKAISYLLFGKTLETESRVKFGDSRYVNNRIKTNFCSVYGVIESNGLFYGVKRTTTLSFSKNGELNGSPTTVSYYLLTSADETPSENNTVDKLDETVKAETQKKINEIIGTYDNFNRIVLTTSDTLNRVLSNDMAEFIDSLLHDSGLDIFDKKLEALKAYNKKRMQLNRVNCNEDVVKEEINKIINQISDLKTQIEGYESKEIPELTEKIKIGGDYIETLMKKLHVIDESLYVLDVDKCNWDIKELNDKINVIKSDNVKITNFINSLKSEYDATELDGLNNKLSEIRKQVGEERLKIKDIEITIRDDEHSIQTLNGNIFRSNNDIKRVENEIEKLQKSTVCPTCNRLLEEDEQNHILSLISDKQNEISVYTNGIKKIKENDIPSISKIIEAKKIKIDEINNEIEKLTISIEPILSRIGEINNDKNDVDKRSKLLLDEANNKIEINTYELKIRDINELIEKHNNVLVHIEKNKKIHIGIDAAKIKLSSITSEYNSINKFIIESNEKIKAFEVDILNKQSLLKAFKEQQRNDYIISLYNDCVHRDGIPRTLLVNKIIPKINEMLKQTLEGLDFVIWIDLNDLKPKLVYNDRPDAIIDCISSSGMERTFSSIALKFALNQINIKSKPLFLLLDEVMGKLVDDSVEYFNQMVSMIKKKMNRVIIVEHNNNVNPDHLIFVNLNDNAVSYIDLN